MMEISDFASHLLVGIKDMKKQSTKEKKIDEFLDRIGCKIMLFKSACGSRFVEFKMQDCISSLLDEERKRPKPSDDSINQPTPNNVPLQMPPHPIPPSLIHVDSISSQPVEDIISSPSGFLTHPLPVLTQESVVELSPSKSLASMIIRIKARHKKNTLHARFQLCQVTTYGAHSAEYSLTVEEAALIFSRMNIKQTKFCTVIPAIKMCQLLHNEWLNTKAMDYWFEIPATRVRGAHFFHSSLATTFVASWLRDDGWPNPLSWRLVKIPNLPQQVNGHDCGFFTLAYVEHIVTGRPMNFNQHDMWYYRAKVVHDIYLQHMATHQHQFIQGH